MASHIVCLFCYKNCHGHESTPNCNNKEDLTSEVSGKLSPAQRFFVLVERFVHQNVPANHKYSPSPWLSAAQDFNQCLGCCENCDTIITTFSSVYHQLILLELQLEWKLKAIVNIMKSASKVPSRVLQLKLAFQNFEAASEKAVTRRTIVVSQNMTTFKHFRTRFLKQCVRKLEKSQPQVLVKRIKNSNQPADSGGTPKTNFIVTKDVHDYNSNKQQDVEDVTNSNSTADIVPNSVSEFHKQADEASFVSGSSAKKRNGLTEACCDNKTSSSSNDCLPDRLSPEDAIDANEDVCESVQNVLQSDKEFVTASGLKVKTQENVLKTEETALHTAKMDDDPFFSVNNDGSDENEIDDQCSSTMFNQVDDHFGNNDIDKEIIFSNQDVSPEDENKPFVSAGTDAITTVKQENGMLRLENEYLAETATSAYNLRENRKRTYKVVESEEEDNESYNANDNNEYYDSDGSSLSSSSNSSSTNSTDVKICQVTANEGAISAKYYYCRDDGCCRQFLDKRLYEDHRKLHVANDLKCNFCNVVEKNVILLSNHERMEHPNAQQDNGFISCPRCAYKTKFPGIYQLHFAMEHIEGLKRVLPTTSHRIMRGSSRENSVSCKICQKKVQKKTQKEHFQRYHDVTDTDGNQILPCSISGCAAYFKLVNQVYEHEKKVHNIISHAYGNHQKLSEPGSYKCNFCDLVENNVIRLSTHERTMHQSTTILDKDSCAEINDSGVVSCPRCTFEAQNVAMYQCHFAKTHFLGFEDCEQNSAELSTVRCEMCNMEIDRSQRKSHFAVYHDISGVDPSRTRKCIADGCKAVFRKRSQWIAHTMIEHASISAAEKQMAKRRVFFANYKLACTFDKCRKKFRTEDDMDIHRKLHGSFNCKFCKMVKNYAPELALHELQHAKGGCKKRGLKGYFCVRCPSYFFKQSIYIRHHLEEHLNLSGNKPTQICPICKVESSQKEDFLTLHYKTYHNTERMDAADIQRCDHCTAYFITPQQLAIHKIKDHFKGKCPECNKFNPVDISSFLLHMDEKHPQIDHFPNFKFRCDIGNCKRRYGTETDLERHKKNDVHYDDRLIKCLECNKELQGEKKLRAHIIYYHSANSHICSECGKIFRTQAHLFKHLEYHKPPEEWKFECPICGKKCVNNWKLGEHKRTHSREKPHICHFCGEKYAHRHNLKNHMRTKHKKEFDEVEAQSSKRVGNFMSRKGSKKGDCIVAGRNTQADKS